MKSVLITGAGRGIGLGLTKIFSENGFRVIATYRNKSSAADLFDYISIHKNSNITPVVTDVTKDSSLNPLKDALEKLGSLDILINNSGVIGSSSVKLSDLNLDELKAVLDVNALGPMRISRLCTPFMKNGGTIAHITSLMGSIQDNKGGGYYDYRMSKAALNMFNKCLSIEFPNITCLVLHPGWVQTDMGGPNAIVSVQESANGLFKVIVKAKLEQTGCFYDFSGKSLSW